MLNGVLKLNLKSRFLLNKIITSIKELTHTYLEVVFYTLTKQQNYYL